MYYSQGTYAANKQEMYEFVFNTRNLEILPVEIIH